MLDRKTCLYTYNFSKYNQVEYSTFRTNKIVYYQLKILYEEVHPFKISEVEFFIVFKIMLKSDILVFN